ncbi:hypothetical protein GE09DRAFT_1223383 [Coniochaeta sp. 2T2.1]|nr:hypothetical protein GE09DRAFT_1223383 [Coniochaeta sp. 2T2.1]
MGIDAGFDMVPRLSQDTGVKEMCQGFITMVKTIYSADDNVDFKQHFIQFNAGKHPLLPYDGHKFLRFSSKSPEGLLRKPMRSTTSGSLSTLPGSILVPAFDLVGVPWDRHGARVASKTGPRSTTQSEATAWTDGSKTQATTTTRDTPLFDIQQIPPQPKGGAWCLASTAPREPASFKTSPGRGSHHLVPNAAVTPPTPHPRAGSQRRARGAMIKALDECFRQLPIPDDRGSSGRSGGLFHRSLLRLPDDKCASGVLGARTSRSGFGVSEGK